MMIGATVPANETMDTAVASATRCRVNIIPPVDVIGLECGAL